MVRRELMAPFWYVPEEMESRFLNFVVAKNLAVRFALNLSIQCENLMAINGIVCIGSEIKSFGN